MRKFYVMLALLTPNLNVFASTDTSKALATTAMLLTASVTAANMYHAVNMPKTHGVVTCKAETAAALLGVLATTTALTIQDQDAARKFWYVSACATTLRRVLANQRLQLSKQMHNKPEIKELQMGRLVEATASIFGFDTWENKTLREQTWKAYEKYFAALDEVNALEKASAAPVLYKFW